MNTSAVRSLHVYIHTSCACKRAVTRVSDVLTCACKCAVSQTLGSLHILMHTSVTRLTAQLVEHIRQSDYCTFTCTHSNMLQPECLTCACKCAVSQTLGSLHIFMHISVTRLTAQLQEHIRLSDHCTFTCTPHVHVIVQ